MTTSEAISTRLHDLIEVASQIEALATDAATIPPLPLSRALCEIDGIAAALSRVRDSLEMARSRGEPAKSK